MLENKLINDKRNSIGTPVYYLGDFALQLLKRNPPNVDSRPEVYANSLATSLERGQAKINKNNSDSPATKPPTVTPLNNRKRKSSTSDKTSKGDTSSEEKDYDAASSDSDSEKAEKKTSSQGTSATRALIIDSSRNSPLSVGESSESD